ncbi:MAG: hypothetical protein IJ008_03375 [Clostridia bacterium]|nr:hypothetical protein [Clostridia bacterium]
MDYNEFIDRKEAHDKFLEYRKDVYDAAEGKGTKGSFNRVFGNLSAKAYGGDPIAQDVVAYFFNKGIEGRLPEDFDLYMSWQILAAANGNEFAIKKLEFFLTYALDRIADHETALEKAFELGNITEENYLYVIGNLLCEGIVDIVKIDPKNLIEKQNEIMNSEYWENKSYSMEQNRVYSRAMEDCLPKVIEYLST